MLSEDSSSEEFYDCDCGSPSKTQTKRFSKSHIEVSHINDKEFSDVSKIQKEEKEKTVMQLQLDLQNQQQQQPLRKDEFKFMEPKPSGRQRFRELKNSMYNEDDDGLGLGNTPDSQNSSAKSVDAASKVPKHPFRVIDNTDTMSIQSMTSLGRVGRILSGSLDPSLLSTGQSSLQQQQMQQPLQTQRPLSQSSSLGNSNSSSNATITVNSQMEKLGVKDGDSQSQNSDTTECSTTRSFPLQEPDVIASTKLAPSKTTDSITLAGPVPPPRRKKGRKISSSSSEHFNINESVSKVMDKPVAEQLVIDVPSSSSSHSLPATSQKEQTATSDTKSEKILPSPGTLLAITKEIESSFSDASIEQKSSQKISRTSSHNEQKSSRNFTGSLKQISSLDNPGIVSGAGQKGSPTSVKSNSAPGRVCSSTIDPNQGLNIYKAIQGKYVVKPQDDVFNKAEGPQVFMGEEDIDRINKIRSEIMENTIINGSDRFKFSGVGSNSLGSSSKYNNHSNSTDKAQRRKSAGDEDILKQLNVYVRTRTDSGKPLTDMEILEQVPVKNLDTGETLPLSAAEEKLQQCINPLSLHIMRLTSHIPESDEESVGPAPGSEAQPEEEEEDLEIESTGRIQRKTAKFKKFLSTTAKKAASTAKSFAAEVSHARHKEDVADIVDVVNPEQNIKIKASKTNTGPYEFAKLQHVQDLSGEHQGAVWCMKFSSCGRLLATAGQDKVLRIWVLKDAFQFFQDMRTKYNAEKSSPTPSQESLVSHHSFEEQIAAAEKSSGPFMPKSFCSYTGHTSDLLDVSWSKNYFILSSSMDKTVRLWHISRKECLCCFQHIDFVTAICFHPRDDRYFLSGSLDGKLRLWNIPDKKVALWNEVDGQTKLITAANFCQNGKFAVVGSYDGRCLFYNTDQLKYHTQIHVRSTRGKNATGRKISGIEPMPGEDKILVTSNDSRVRLYDLRDLNLSCKYKGYMNVSSQIKASFSHDGKYIISGSENQCIYIWKTHHDYAKLSSVRRDRSDFWEGIKAHNATVTCAIFAPHPEAIIKPEVDNELSEKTSNSSQPADPLVEQRKKGCGGYVLVSADFNGCIKVFINKTKPKHSSLPYTALD